MTTPTAQTAHPSPTAISVNQLTKSYGSKRVLDGLDLTVPTGSVLALLGPNGAGKTTTVEILQGLRRRAGGTVSVLGEDPARAGRAWRARIGVVSQSSTDMGDLTVTEAVEHISRFYAEPADTAETVARVGLADDARTRASRLSGGRRRRLDVALAIIGRPELLFLAVPTTGFDPVARRGGVGRVLLTAVAEAVNALRPAADLYSVVNATNHASVGLHLLVGFERLARLGGFGAVTFEDGQGVLLRRAG